MDRGTAPVKRGRKMLVNWMSRKRDRGRASLAVGSCPCVGRGARQAESGGVNQHAVASRVVAVFTSSVAAQSSRAASASAAAAASARRAAAEIASVRIEHGFQQVSTGSLLNAKHKFGLIPKQGTCRCRRRCRRRRCRRRRLVHRRVRTAPQRACRQHCLQGWYTLSSAMPRIR